MPGFLNRVVFSYVVDWVIVVVVAAAGGVLNYITGYHRPFTLTEYDISYPLMPDIVSIPVVVIVALIAPAVIIFLLSLLATTGDKLTPKSLKWRAAAWEIHVGWLGLASGLAVTLFITSGLKDMVGKPRPDLLARCNPDLTDISKFIVGGLANSLNSEAEPLVNDGICQQTDQRVLDDGFAAFPSGHSSFSSAGLVYLTLWLCTRLSVNIPYLDHGISDEAWSDKQDWIVPVSKSRTAPPLWQVCLALCPIPAALFISASRYADFHHAGIDITAGVAIGTLFGWASFRLYHLPMRRTRGVIAWGPRPRHYGIFAKAVGGVQNVSNHSLPNNQPENNGGSYMMTDLEARQGDENLRRVYSGGSSDPVLQRGGERVYRQHR